MNGCATSAYSRGICYTHGRKPCTVEGCGKREVTFAANTAGAMGSARDCIAWGCNTNAHAGMKGLCKKHSKDKAACSTSGCSNGVVARRLCAKHGAFGFCSTDGCGSGAVKDGLAWRPWVLLVSKLQHCCACERNVLQAWRWQFKSVRH